MSDDKTSKFDNDRDSSSNRGTALAEPRRGESSRGKGAEKGSKSMEPTTSDRGGRSERPKSSPFEIYKSGQGYWVRMGTAIGGGLLVAAGAHFLWKQMEVFVDASKPWTLWLQIIPALLVLVGLGYLLFWFVGTNRNSSDFLIATEGEMKKVSWSSRREIIGSTKVVIFFLIFMGVLLFAIDVLFWSFFSAIGVLKGPNPWQTFFGMGS